MKQGKTTKTAGIRRRAEKLLQVTERDVAAMPATDVQQLVHELQVHQIELNAQNDELRRTQLELEAARDRYRDLYDFAPAAHLTMDTHDTIVEANLRATALLGIDRQRLIGQPLARFFASDDKDIFYRHSQDVLKTGTRQTCEMRLRDAPGAVSWVHLESLAIHEKAGPITHWRTALLDITERKEAEQAKSLIEDLTRSQQYFRALFNQTPSAVGISTVAEGRLCDVNEEFCRLTGYTREELLGRTTLELGLWADPSERATVLREIQTQGYLHNREGLLRTKSGEIRSLMVTVDSIQLGSTPCLIYLAHDITERKLTEEALRLAKFSMDRAADAVYWIDPQAKVLDVNEAAVRMLGYSKDELCAMTVHDLNPDFQADMWPGFWAETRRHGTMVIETCHKAKNGRLIPIEVSVNFLSYEGKEYHCAFVRDITERKRHEEALRESELRFRRIVGQTSVGVVQADPAGRMTLVNQSWCQMLGYSETELLQMNIADVTHPVSLPATQEAVRRLAEGGPDFQIEKNYRRKDGSVFTARSSVSALRRPDGDYLGLIAVVLDITDRIRNENLLAEQQQLLELIAAGRPLIECLNALTGAASRLQPNTRAAVLMPNAERSAMADCHSASLRPAFGDGIAGTPINDLAISTCGTAIFTGEPVTCSDIARTEYWSQPWRDLCLAHDILACHSTPVFGPEGKTVASFFLSFTEAREPDAWERRISEFGAHVAGIAIERDRVEKALHESEERYRSLVTIITDVPWVTDPIGAFITPQPAWEAYTGQSWEQHRSFGWTEALHPDDRERVKAISLKVCEAKTIYESHGRIWHAPSQRWRYFIAHATPLFNADGSVRQWVGTCTDVDDAKRSEDALRESEARFRSLVSNFPGAVYRCACDSDWTMEFLSDPIEQLCGYPASDFLANRARSYTSVIHPNDRQMVEHVVLDAVTQRRPYTIEYRLLHKDGGARWVHEKGQGIFAADGRVLWLDGAIFDITERKRAEEALRRSEAFISSVVENLPIMIFVKDAKDLTFVRFNKTGEDLLGHSREVLIGKSDYDVFPKGQADFFTDNDRRILQTGGVLDIPEEVIGTKHQGLRILHTKKIPLYDDTGAPRYLVGISEDITERKRTEKKLKESEDRYRSIFEKAVDGIFQTTPDGKYVAANPALARIYGYDSPDDMIAAITDIASQLYVDAGQRDEFLRVMQAQEELTGFESLVYRKDGSFMWISESARTLRDQTGTVVGYEGTVEDITERKRAEGRLRVTLDHVRTLSRRLATIQEEERAHLARELHDELGVRLTCLKIDLSRLMSLVGNRVRADLRAKLDDRIRSMVGQVDSTIASLQQLVTQLRPTLLDDLGLVAALEWQSRDFQKRTGISCTCVTNADEIAMEPERATAVFRICQEALTNTARHAQATAVTITIASQRDSLQLVVADNGVGVPDTKASDRRSLGLIGMQERAAQCGGTVTVEGDPEKGTTVTLCLPVG